MNSVLAWPRKSMSPIKHPHYAVLKSTIWAKDTPDRKQQKRDQGHPWAGRPLGVWCKRFRENGSPSPVYREQLLTLLRNISFCVTTDLFYMVCIGRGGSLRRSGSSRTWNLWQLPNIAHPTHAPNHSDLLHTLSFHCHEHCLSCCVILFVPCVYWLSSTSISPRMGTQEKESLLFLLLMYPKCLEQCETHSDAQGACAEWMNEPQSKWDITPK